MTTPQVAGRGGDQRGPAAGDERAPTTIAKVRKAYPFADLLREQLKDAVPRPETPAYSDVTLAVQQTLHPPAAINPDAAIKTLKDRLNTLADGGMY